MSLFIRRSGIANPPWKAVKSPKGNSFDLFDANDRLIARFPWHSVALHDPEILANIAVMTAAPELLGALRELCFHMDRLNIPLSENFYELMNRASPGMPPLTPPVNASLTQTPLPGSDEPVV